MLTHAQLMTPGLDDPDDTPDFAVGIGQQVIRCRFRGARAVALGGESSPKTQIAALLDLLDLHLSTPATHHGVPVATDRVAVLLGGRHKDSAEAVDALQVLAAVLQGPAVKVYEHDAAGHWRLTDRPLYDPSVAAEHYAKLLAAVPSEPPALVKQLIADVGVHALRAYPMLTSRGRTWSVRMEGLQIGVLSAVGGWLDVGRTGSKGAVGPARRHWQASTGWQTKQVLTPGDLGDAAHRVGLFAASWLAQPDACGAGPAQQDEHALESRILRGAVTLTTNDNSVLELLWPHPEVNWGSQFPTRWGQGGKARYLDGLVRIGPVPWALEMKIAPSSGGLRQYYRHAIVQAVLYREFIKRSTPLQGWFLGQGLNRALCRAAVVVPSLAEAPKVLIPLQRLCEAFDVTLIQVPHEAAVYRHLILPTHQGPAVPAPRQPPPSPTAIAAGLLMASETVGPALHTEC